MTGLKEMKLWFLSVALVTLFLPVSAQAGHLFTQASANTPVNLTAGTGIQITQLTYEGGGNAGRVSLNFLGDWDSGDAIRITIKNYTQTFTYDAPLSGTSQSGSALSVIDPTLAAAGITQNGSTQWTVIATTGTFTFQGYRIYTGNDTFNGTGADTITQAQVVSASSLGSGFVPYSNSTNVGLAQELDALNGTASGELAAVITAISAMTPESKQLALKLIAPETSQVTGQAAMNTAIAALDSVQLRLDSLRAGVGLSNFAHSSSEGMASGDAELKHNMWIKLFGANGRHDAKDGYASAEDSIYGTIIGYDAPVGGGWTAGAAFGYAKTNVKMNDYRSGDGADIETYQLTGYFGRSFGRWYLDGMLALARQDYLTTRDTHLTGVAEGSFKGDLYGMRLLAGMPVTVRSGITLTPYAGLELARVNQHSYTETGAGALSLNVAANSADRVRSHLGAELATLKKLQNGGVIRPALKLNWRHEFRDDGVVTNTSLVGGGSQFETLGQSINSDVFGLSARLNWERTERMNLVLEVGGEAGSGYQSYSGQIMGGWRF